MVAVVFALAVVLAPAATAASGDLTNHHGPVVRAGKVYLIFWLPRGRHFDAQSSDTTFESFARSGLASVGSSPWWNTLSQYGVHTTLTIGGSWIDTNAYPHAGTGGDPLQTTDYRASVRRALAANGWSPGLDRMYLVLTANDTEACGFDRLVGSGFAEWSTAQPCTFPTSVRNACAGHSFFSSGGRPVVYAILPLSGDRGCKPEPNQSPNHDTRADEAVTVGAGVLAETAVDPLGTGWYVRSAPVGLVCSIRSPFPIHVGAAVYALSGLHSNAQHACVHGYPPLGVAAFISAPRVHVGARERVTVTTAPHAAVHVSLDNGGDSRGFETTANARGRFTYSWVVRSQPRRGSVTLTATLNGRSGSATVRFHVVG